jgi:hypothetical protein
MFSVTKFRQVRASRGARVGRVEWGVAFNGFQFQCRIAEVTQVSDFELDVSLLISMVKILTFGLRNGYLNSRIH